MTKIWQEYVFLIGGFVLAAALLPTVFGDFKPDSLTSLITGTVLSLYTVTFWTLKQKVSAFGIGSSAILWIILLIQSL